MPFAERFLTDTAAFPPRLEGRAWGQQNLELDLPGGPYLLDGVSAAQRAELTDRFGDLCREPAGPPQGKPSLSLFQAPAAWFRAVDFTGQEYTFDRDYRAEAVRVAGQGFLGMLDLRVAGRAGLWVSAEADLVAQGIFENFMRLFLAYRLLVTGGSLLHSAAVVKNGHAHVFIGRSGAGKSTISRLGLAAWLDVLSDDMNALVPGGGRYWAEKLPFAGDLGQTATPKGRYPVAGIYRLEQARENHIQPLSAARALAALVACAPFVNADPHRGEALAASLERLIESVPVRELGFNLDGRVWKVL
jgi:hypothetical protein